MHTRDLDLNLLQTFHAVHATGNVSRAAERLGVSQPTVSHALRRLRAAATAIRCSSARRAAWRRRRRPQRLAKAVDHALTTLDVAIRETETYDPARSERTFRLHLTDIGETIFLPPLIQALARDAPRVRLEAFQLDDRDILPALESGRIDLALGYIPALDRRAAAVPAVRALRRRDARGASARARASRRAPRWRGLHYALVRSHPATGRALQELGLRDRVRLDAAALHGAAAHPRRDRPRGADAVAPGRRVHASSATTRSGGRASACPGSTSPCTGSGASTNEPGQSVAARTDRRAVRRGLGWRLRLLRSLPAQSSRAYPCDGTSRHPCHDQSATRHPIDRGRRRAAAGAGRRRRAAAAARARAARGHDARPRRTRTS